MAQRTAPSSAARPKPQRPGSDRIAEDEVGNLARAGLAELIGAFFLIYAGTAALVAATLMEAGGGPPPNIVAIALANGLVLAAMVAALGHVSGAHLNPAVTIGLAVTGKFPWRAVPAYAACQLVGAILGAAATWATFGAAARDTAGLGVPEPADGVGAGQTFLVETLLTFLLVFVVIAVTSDRRASGPTASLSIGCALATAVLIGGPISGAAVNPVRALGPEILTATFPNFWVYVLAPVAGGVVAALAYDRVVGRANPPEPDES